MLQASVLRCSALVQLRRIQHVPGYELSLLDPAALDAALCSGRQSTYPGCSSNSSMVRVYHAICSSTPHDQHCQQQSEVCDGLQRQNLRLQTHQAYTSVPSWSSARSNSSKWPQQLVQHGMQECSRSIRTQRRSQQQGALSTSSTACLASRRHLWQSGRYHSYCGGPQSHFLQHSVPAYQARYSSHTAQDSSAAREQRPWTPAAAVHNSNNSSGGSTSTAQHVQQAAAADSEEDVSTLITPVRRAVVGFYNPDHVHVVPVQQQQQQQHHPASKQPETAAPHWQPQQQQQPWQQQLQQGPPQQTQLQLQELPVFACHLGAEINSADFITKNVLHIKDKYPLKDNVVISAAAEGDDVVFMGERGNQPLLNEQIFVIYRHGSVIFFNMRQRSIDRWLERLQPFVGRGDNPPAGHRHDETKLVIDPTLDSWSRLEPDKIVVQTLDAANARVISNVLGQSVALDYYNQEVDKAIQQFTPYLTKVAELGESSDIKDKELLKLIAENSLLYTDVVTKIGLLDISQTAWTQDKYHDLWTALRKDYELDRRFDAINRKLGPMIENAKFLLDIRAEQKSADAEKIIILLIMLEVAISMVGFWL